MLRKVKNHCFEVFYESVKARYSLVSNHVVSAGTLLRSEVVSRLTTQKLQHIAASAHVLKAAKKHRHCDQIGHTTIV